MSRTITYWIADHTRDPDDPCAGAYAARGKLKRDVVAKVNERGPADYGKPYKVTVEFDDLTDLVDMCLCEGGAWWEIDDE